MKHIDLHLHLDGSLRTNTVIELAEKSNILLPKDKLLVEKMLKISDSNQNLVEYLSKFELPIKLMQTEESLYRVGFEIIEDLAKEGHIYAEIRFAPQLHTTKNLNENQVIKAVNLGMKNASSKYGIDFGIILCAMRHEPVSNAVNLIAIANNNIENNIVGVDLAGDEFNHSCMKFKDAFSRSNLPITIHAGEARGFNSVKEALEIGATRIGHGIRSIEDEDTIELLIKKNITLEVCPKSNKDTNVFKDFKDYPIKSLLDLGVNIAICTDNKTVSNTNIASEHSLLKELFNFNNSDIKKCTNNSINASFCSDSEKRKLQNKIRKNNYKI
jgi:adenosine deaminase